MVYLHRTTEHIHGLTYLLCLSPRYVRPVPDHCQIMTSQPLEHVVILPSPAPILIGVTVHHVEVLDTDSRGSSEDVGVGQGVVQLVHGHRHVPWLERTGVEITVVLG